MTAKTRVLVIDDERAMRDSIKQALARRGYEVSGAESGEAGLELLEREHHQLVLLDLKMPGLSGIETLERISKKHPGVTVLVITGYATIESTVKAIKLGAYDYIPKPFTPDVLRAAVNRAMERRALAQENVLLRSALENETGGDSIIGKSVAMRRVERLVLKAGPVDSTVLISGESGTGKELIARAIHRHSKRSDKPFVAVDCGSLVESLFESELFGHVKGSFTGATDTKYGRFELADGGTLFFDEIANISDRVQAKLLRAIQEREVTKVGSAQVVKVDVRLVCASNKDLQQEVKAGRFREDLFYRISVVPIKLPPLRERREDIPLLARHFLEIYSRKRKKPAVGLSRRALEVLVEYNWPGNVRELENAIERAVVLSTGELIDDSDLMYYGVGQVAGPEEGKVESLDDIEKEHIDRTLRSFNGHKDKTASALGIDRKTLRLKMRRYGIR